MPPHLRATACAARETERKSGWQAPELAQSLRPVVSVTSAEEGRYVATTRSSGQALSDVVKPIMLAAGVPAELAHPHVLRHTYGSLFMRRGGGLSRLRVLMGHASTDTTAVYVHHQRVDLETGCRRLRDGT